MVERAWLSRCRMLPRRDQRAPRTKTCQSRKAAVDHPKVRESPLTPPAWAAACNTARLSTLGRSWTTS